MKALQATQTAEKRSRVDNQRYDILSPEKALLGPSGGISSCSQCGTALGYTYPAHRYTAVYCSPACVHATHIAQVSDDRLTAAVTP